MKTTKRVIAIVLAALMLAMMIPFAASAETALTIKNSSTEFAFNVYKIATLNETTGAYTTVATAADSIVKGDKSGKDLLDALDALPKGELGAATALAKKTGSTDSSVSFTEAGIYYVRVDDTQLPDNTTLRENSVFVPQKQADGTWTYASAGVNFDVANNKVSTSPVGVHKGFSTSATNHAINSDSAQYKGEGDKVYFTLEATVLGSTTENVKTFVIRDTMSEGLTYNNDAVVYYLNTTDTESSTGSDFTVTTASITADGAYKNGTQINATLTNKTSAAYYGATKVRVVYSATVNNKAKVNAANPNKVYLDYQTVSDTEVQTKPGEEVEVWTLVARVVKVDASNNNAPLEGATFGLYSDADATTKKAEGTSGRDGIVKFYEGGDATKNEIRLANGKPYYVKEISAPQGYTKNTKIYTVDVNKTNAIDGVVTLDEQITNTKTRLPQTGGEGTMLFTIIGGSLIVLAGVLFVIVMKKRSAK